MQLIQGIVRIIGLIPRPAQRLLGLLIAQVMRFLPTQTGRLTEMNIDLAYPELSQPERKRLTHASLEELSHKFFDLINTWTHPHHVLRSQITAVEAPDLTEYVDRPTLVLLPHLGNWELFGVWISQIRPYTALFRPLRTPVFSDLVKTARERGGNRLVPTDSSGIKSLLRDLKSGKQAIVLPDQSPVDGGIFASFFGIATATATLPYRLAKSANAHVLIGAAIRQGRGYKIIVRELAPAGAMDQDQWLIQMNAEIETLVRQYPEQYQWEYRRFRKAPDGTLRYP